MSGIVRKMSSWNPQLEPVTNRNNIRRDLLLYCCEYYSLVILNQDVRTGMKN